MSKSLDMDGPYTYDKETVEEEVLPNEIGNYALGYKEGYSFKVGYVGRSDSDVQQRLFDHLNEDDDQYEYGYTHFMFSYAKNKKVAFEKECKNWHDFGGEKDKLTNDIHPDKPDGTDYKCPVDGCIYSIHPDEGDDTDYECLMDECIDDEWHF